MRRLPLGSNDTAWFNGCVLGGSGLYQVFPVPCSKLLRILSNLSNSHWSTVPKHTDTLVLANYSLLLILIVADIRVLSRTLTEKSLYDIHVEVTFQNVFCKQQDPFVLSVWHHPTPLRESYRFQPQIRMVPSWIPVGSLEGETILLYDSVISCLSAKSCMRYVCVYIYIYIHIYIYAHAQVWFHVLSTWIALATYT